MVTRAFVLVAALAGTARAQDFAQPPPELPRHRCALVADLEDEADEPLQQALGLRIGFGKLPVDDLRLTTMSIALGIEHVAFGSPARPVRILGELEWVWLGIPPADSSESTVLSGSGTRASLGLRRTIADVTAGGFVRFYADGELGGALLLASHPEIDHVLIQPAGFAGLRIGYDFLASPRQRGSRAFEAEVSGRVLAVDGGYGYSVGIGMLWRD